MRSPKMVLLIAIALAAVGLLLVFPFSGGSESFAVSVYTPHPSHPAHLLNTTQTTWGAVVVWIASLLIAGVIGHRIATEPRSE